MQCWTMLGQLAEAIVFTHMLYCPTSDLGSHRTTGDVMLLLEGLCGYTDRTVRPVLLVSVGHSLMSYYHLRSRWRVRNFTQVGLSDWVSSLFGPCILETGTFSALLQWLFMSIIF